MLSIFLNIIFPIPSSSQPDLRLSRRIAERETYSSQAQMLYSPPESHRHEVSGLLEPLDVPVAGFFTVRNPARNLRSRDVVDELLNKIIFL
jgi:hypothetical protein